MHYGTVVDEGATLIENLLNPQSRGDDIPIKDYIAKKIAKWRGEHVSEERISVRRKAEGIARNLLNEKVGNFDEGLLRKFFELINEDFWKDKIKHTRFGLAYTGHNVNEMIKQLDKVNEWIDRLWKTPETELKQILNEYYTQNPIKNAGRAFPSLILYIRDSNKFNNCFHRMITGLKNLTNFSKNGYSGDFYFEYNDEVNRLKKEHGLIPEEIDILLCLAEAEVPETEKHPEALFYEKTFKLLQDLHDSPYRDFYQKKRNEFKMELEEPFQQLFRDVASKLPTFALANSLAK